MERQNLHKVGEWKKTYENMLLKWRKATGSKMERKQQLQQVSGWNSKWKRRLIDGPLETAGLRCNLGSRRCGRETAGALHADGRALALSPFFSSVTPFKLRDQRIALLQRLSGSLQVGAVLLHGGIKRCMY